MATNLGKAYVQIMPSAKGISGMISKELDGEVKSAGQSAGNSLISTIKNAVKKMLTLLSSMQMMLTKRLDYPPTLIWRM